MYVEGEFWGGRVFLAEGTILQRPGGEREQDSSLL